MRAVNLRHLLVITAVLLGSLGGCATPPPAADADAVADFKEANDPLEPTNRAIYAFDDALDTVILRPAAKAYRFIVPAPARTGIHNALTNLGTPVQLGNDILDGRPRRGGDTTMRFLINTTVGVLGIFDFAKDWGYPDHDADFGLTLALWGLPEGPFLYLPVFGPSDPRDAIGLAGNAVMDPFTWVGQGTTVRALDWSRMGVNAIDQRERLLMTSTVQRKRRWTPTRRSAACTGSIGTGRSTIFAKTRAPQFRYGSRNRAHPIKSPIHRPYRRPIDRGHSTPCLTAATSWF